MDVNLFRKRIARWRLERNLSQEALDRICGFLPGTVRRLEEEKLILRDETFVRIVIGTGRDLPWTLVEECGSLFQRLEPYEEPLRQQLGKERPPQALDQDGEFQKALDLMVSNLATVLSKQARAGDRRALMIDILSEAAARRGPDGDPPQRLRASRRKTAGAGS
ncbi:MAG TPA: helix-turn-helix transcriptional regulator [Thermoanaerobaculia bacterium]|jgi:transcriptional regulator with XRE-family HTH domain